MSDRGRGDPEIVRADDLPAFGELCPDVSVHPRDRLGDRDRLQPCEQVLDERAAARAASPGRAVHAVQQLAYRDDADRALLVAEQAIDLRRTGTVLEVDQQVGVDQDGHNGSGGATVLRSARSSPANSSSGAGAVAISSRNRSADSSRVFGGVIVATGAPARVTSTSSPAATRFKTSEKLRAASVAVIRDTTRVYQINQIPSDQAERQRARKSLDRPVRSRRPRERDFRVWDPVKVRAVAKRNGAARGHRDRRRAPRAVAGRETAGGLDEEVERTEAQRLADDGWVEWGGELIWAVGFTSGGAPYGLRVSDFDPADLQAMGLDVAVLDDAGLATAEPSIDESDGWLRDDDVPF